MENTRRLRERPRDHGRNTRSQTDRSSSSVPPQYNESLTRPNWDKDVRARVFADALDSSTDLYKCAITGRLFPREEMQIDHIKNWEDWCIRNVDDPNNPQQMSDAYNDRRNLRLIHGGVNASKGKGSKPGKSYLKNL